MSYNVLYRKYRPMVLDDLVGQDNIVRLLKNSIKKNKLSHAYLFSGVRGTGKTTTARILARYVNCLDPQGTDPCNKCENCVAILNGAFMDVEEIDAASNRGINEARELRERVSLATQAYNGYRVIIIDEAHQLTPEASQSLLKTFEEPPPNTMFILCTTEPHQILDTIHSRCQCLNFKPVKPNSIVNYIKKIADSEGWILSDDIIQKIAVLGSGSVRDSISQLEKVSSCVGENGEVIEEDANMVMGVIDEKWVFDYMNAVLNKDLESVFNIVNNIVSNGYDMQGFVKDLITFIKDLIYVRLCKNTDNLYNRTDGEKKELLQISKNFDNISFLSFMMSVLDNCYFKVSSNRNLPQDSIFIEASMRIVAKIVSNKKKGE